MSTTHSCVHSWIVWRWENYLSTAGENYLSTAHPNKEQTLASPSSVGTVLAASKARKRHLQMLVQQSLKRRKIQPSKAASTSKTSFMQLFGTTSWSFWIWLCSALTDLGFKTRNKLYSVCLKEHYLHLNLSIQSGRCLLVLVMWEHPTTWSLGFHSSMDFLAFCYVSCMLSSSWC